MKKDSLLRKLTIYVAVGSALSAIITLIVLYFVLHITGVPAAEIPKTLIFSGVVIVLIFMLPVFFVRAFLYKLLIEKIELLTETMERVSKGDIETPIEPLTNDEFGKMAEAFEKMRVSIKEMLDKLEGRLDRER